MLPRLSRFPTCHNDVINAGQNNRLFVLGTDMDRGCLRLSHMQKGTYYAQICDKESLLTASRKLLHAFPSMFVSSLCEFPENCAYKHDGLNCFIEYLRRKSLTDNFLSYDIESAKKKCIYWIYILKQ